MIKKTCSEAGLGLLINRPLEQSMGYGADDMWRVWSDLERKEDELKWGGHLSGVGPQYNSMGRPANASAHFNNGWANERMGRVNRVRQALRDSAPMAQGMIARTLSGIDLSMIWPILASGCQDVALYYGGSAAAGGLIGGVGGAFFGGVGAVPGAAAGATAGGYVGGWALAMMGLQSLVEGLAQAVPEALRYYEKGFLEAWGPTRHDHRHGFGIAARGDPSFAALQLANGHVVMIEAILTALVAYITKGKGDRAALLKEISHSPRLGPRVAKWVEENEGKLRQHPALQSRGRAASPGAEPPPPKRRREPVKGQERDASENSVQNPKITRDAKADYGANNVVMNSGGDRLIGTMGSARVNNAIEYNSIVNDLKSRGVDISYRKGQFAYGPAPSGGRPGNIVFDPDSSLSALKHEYGHFLDDAALEFPGQRYYYENPSARVATERRQYLGEIRTARELGDSTARRQFIDDYLGEKKYLIDNYYTKPYGSK